jgi:hypothetical protein
MPSNPNYERSIVICDKEETGMNGKECFEVLIHKSYGLFHIPDEARDEILKMYPPHTEEGMKLFRKASIPVYKSLEEVPSDKDTYIIEDESARKEFIGEYKKINGYFVSPHYLPSLKIPARNYKFITRGDGIYYDTYINVETNKGTCIWREHKDLIKIMKKLRLIDTEIKRKNIFNTEYISTIGIGYVPVGRKYIIDEYDDGLESIKLKPFGGQVIKDLLRIVQTGNRNDLHKITQDLLDGKVTVSQVLSNYYVN